MKTITKLLDNKLFYVLVSLVASFALWLFVVNEIDPSQERTFTFDVTFEGESVLEAYNLRLASDTPDSIRLFVTGSITDIHRLDENPEIIVDVSGIHEAGEHDLTFRFAAWNTLTGRVSYHTLDDAVSNTDNTIIVRANRITGRTIDLSVGRVNYDVEDSEDEESYFFVRESLNIEPRTIHIDGPEDVLEQIYRIEVDSNFLTPLSEIATQEDTLHAYDRYGEEIPPDELLDVTVFSETPFAEATVSVQAVIRTVKNVPLRVTFEDGAGANEENVTYQILGQDSVWLIGEGDVLRALGDDLPLGRIYLARVDMFGVVRREIPHIPLTTLYDGLDYVDIEVQITGLEERSITVPSDNVHFIGLEADMIAEPAINTLNIVVRGPADLLEDLDEMSISILVDLSDYPGRTGRLLVESFSVRIGDWPPEIIGARDLPGRGIIVNIQRET